MVPLLDGIQEGIMVYAGKSYASRANRQCLQDKGLKDGMMEKAHRGHLLSAAQKMRNGCPAQVRDVGEQSFGIVHRKFRYARAPYFGLRKVAAQSHLKAMCLNLLKAANGMRVSATA